MSKIRTLQCDVCSRTCDIGTLDKCELCWLMYCPQCDSRQPGKKLCTDCTPKGVEKGDEDDGQ